MKIYILFFTLLLLLGCDSSRDILQANSLYVGYGYNKEYTELWFYDKICYVFVLDLGLLENEYRLNGDTLIFKSKLFDTKSLHHVEKIDRNTVKIYLDHGYSRFIKINVPYYYSPKSCELDTTGAILGLFSEEAINRNEFLHRYIMPEQSR